MPDEFMRQMWENTLRNGTPHGIISFVWVYIAENGTLSAFFLMLFTLTLRLMLISFYFSMMYIGIAYLKKRYHKKLSIRANYYCWYILLFSFVLAHLEFNNGFMSLAARLLQTADSQTYMPYAFFALILFSIVWLFVVSIRLVSLARMNGKIRKSMKHMARYDDNGNLAERAATLLGLRRTPGILVAGYIETPVSYGAFKKTVLLPANFREKYTETELCLLILHEMTHIKHGDTVKLYLVSLVHCFLWLSPIMKRFVKSFKRDSELLCDNRVIGLQSGERDVYGNLILKECAYKTARFGFSDSYHAIENRLDALYRYKADGRMKMLIAIPFTALMICVLSYTFRADLLVVNDGYNELFEIYVFDATANDYVVLPHEECVGLFEIVDDRLSLDNDVARVLTGQYAVDGTVSMIAVSDNYVVNTGGTVLTLGYKANHSIQITEPDANGHDIVLVSFTDFLTVRTPAEYLFLRIASIL